MNNGADAARESPTLRLDRVSGGEFVIHPKVQSATLSCSALMTIATLANAATTRYVRADAPPGGAGTSWASAHNDLQTALSTAVSGDQIWVKAGVYRPGPVGSPRTVTFQMKSGVAVYGGFAGHETALAQRDWKANTTVLSGDLGLNDAPNFANRSDNAYHVVSAYTVMFGAVLDGFTVRGGNADNSWGGGVVGANASLSNLNITDNEAFSGGGIGVPETGFSLTGGPIVGCTIRGNRATSGGGGMMISVSNFALRECVIAKNSAATGGGVYIFLPSQGPGTMRNCVVVGNSSSGGGPTGIYSQWCQLTVVNSTIAFNHSPNSVGGVFGGGQPSAALTLANSIVWGNTSGAAVSVYDKQVWLAVAIASCAIEGANPPFGADPRWRDADGPDNLLGTADDDFRLSCLSPYIDRGANSYSTGIAFDLAGAPRFADDPATPDTGVGTSPIVDLGAYEFVCGCDEHENYCATNSNSSGAPAAIRTSGSTSLFANALAFHVDDAAPNRNGIFFYGANAIATPWGEGVRCVASPLFRLPLLTTDALGSASLALDVTQPPASSGPGQLLAGSSWRFQFYFRDPAGGPSGWNTSNGLRVTFCP